VRATRSPRDDDAQKNVTHGGKVQPAVKVAARAACAAGVNCGRDKFCTRGIPGATDIQFSQSKFGTGKVMPLPGLPVELRAC
jgi:hypothetical protein